MRNLNVVTATANYTVHIGDNILSAELRKYVDQSARVLIVTDATIAELHLKTLQEAVTDVNCDTVILAAGEANKTWAQVTQILDALINHGHDRYSTIISLGGGVIGDLTGFAAAIYMRGMRWLQIPTTLLAQVDASVGGKTGCNYGGSKNVIGVFKQPDAVIIDTQFLQTLSQREYINGLVEVIKCAFACDADFFAWLENNLQQLQQRERCVLIDAIVSSLRIKISLVQQDELDNGVRQYLNFGHTFGHAIEAATNFEQYLHGEAVAIGMLLETHHAVEKGLIDAVLEARLRNMLSYLGLPLELHDAEIVGSLYNYMRADKKKRGDKIRMILPCALGRVTVVEE